MKKRKKFFRIIRYMYLCVLFFGSLTIHTYAAEVDSQMNQMVSDIWSWYLLMRNTIALPLLSLNYAVCGLQFLGSAFMGSSVNIDAVKKKALYGTLAMFALFFLPTIIMAVKELLQSTAWQPPTPSPL